MFPDKMVEQVATKGIRVTYKAGEMLFNSESTTSLMHLARVLPKKAPLVKGASRSFWILILI